MSHARFMARSIDPLSPQEGQRLEAANIAAALNVSMRDMAEAARISSTALFKAITENRWPVRTEAESIRAAVAELLKQRGATDEQLGMLWHAHVARKRHRNLPYDKRGYPTDYVPRERPRKTPPPAPEIEEDTDMLLPKQTLTRAASKAFKLFVNPFDGDVQSEDAMFVNDEIAYVREACWQAAKGGRFVAIVSESGGGKTTIVQDLEARIQRDRSQVIVIRPSVLGMEDSGARGYMLKAGDILAAIITTLDPLATVPQTLEARSKKVAKLLAASIDAGYQHLLVIEEAHCLPDATLKHCKRLHEMHVGRRPMLGILLVAQPELALKLDPKRPALREVTQRCEIVQLLPLDADLQAYLGHRATLAGRDLAEFIDNSGIEEIRTRLTVTARTTGAGKTRTASLLYPLAVNNLVTAALNEAAELGVPVINRDVVRAV